MAYGTCDLWCELGRCVMDIKIVCKYGKLYEQQYLFCDDFHLQYTTSFHQTLPDKWLWHCITFARTKNTLNNLNAILLKFYQWETASFLFHDTFDILLTL